MRELTEVATWNGVVATSHNHPSALYTAWLLDFDLGADDYLTSPTIMARTVLMISTFTATSETQFALSTKPYLHD